MEKHHQTSHSRTNLEEQWSLKTVIGAFSPSHPHVVHILHTIYFVLFMADAERLFYNPELHSVEISFVILITVVFDLEVIL